MTIPKPLYKYKLGSDHYQTPPHALLPLLPILPPKSVIWEPACGKGNIVTTLHNFGFNMIGTDILTGDDFLTMTPPSHNLIITNPPYSLKNEWLQHQARNV
jgi:hypothetical protein